VKRAIPWIIAAAALVVGGLAWFTPHGAAPAAPAAAAPQGEAKPAEEEAEGPKVTRDASGRAVIAMSDEVQGDLGIVVRNPAPFRLEPELKGYGRVLDPAPLAALLNELAAAQAASAASSNELARLKTLEGQGNASVRVLQTAEAAALRDQLAVRSTRDRLVLSWGKAVADCRDLAALVLPLASLETALVRIDLPAGEKLALPQGAHLSTLAGASMEAEYLGLAPTVDPQMLGRGFLFLCPTNASRLPPGEAVVGYLKVPGEPLEGIVIPRDAVVRTEGAGWVYVLDNAGAEAFTRTEIPLDRATPAGWFITNGVAASDYVVTKGAQQLLSIELKGAGGGD
jgi:hypothetical protein